MNESEISEFGRRFASSGPQEKGGLLGALAHSLTVSVRELYFDDFDGDQIAALRAVNELMHQVTAELREIAARRPGRFGHETILGFLREAMAYPPAAKLVTNAVRMSNLWAGPKS